MRTRPIADSASPRAPLPRCLDGFEVVGLDGQAIKRVARRVKPLRGVAGGFLGGRALVAMDVRRGLATAMHAHPDGDANDTRFVCDLVPVVRRLIDKRRLWIADSAFCELTRTAHFTSEPGDAFLVRHHPRVHFEADPNRPAGTGINHHGRPYREDWGWLGSATNKKRRYVRRITSVGPSRTCSSR